MKISAFYENIVEGARYDGIELQDALAQLKQDGMEKVYISYDTLKDDTDEKNRKMLKELGVGVEGLYGFIRFDQDPADKSYRGLIDLAVKLNAGNILIVPGFVEENEKNEEERIKRNMREGLERAVRYGKEQGIEVSIEDFDGLTAPYCNVSGVADFLDHVPGLRFSFDTGNFVMYHDDEVEAFERFRDKICTVHLKDRCLEAELFSGEGQEPGAEDGRKASVRKDLPVVICADGERVCTVPVGDGYIRMREILARLKQQGYDGGLIAEMYGHPAENMYEGIRRSVKWIRKEWESISGKTKDI